MFNEIELKILKTAYDKYGFSDPYVDVGAVRYPPSAEYHSARGLDASGLISMDGRCFVAITESGIRALNEEYEETKKEAEEKAHQAAQEKKAERLVVKEARRSWLQLFVAAFLGWLVSGAYSAADAFRFIAGLFK